MLQAKVEKDGYREEKKGIQQELPKSGGVGRAVWTVFGMRKEKTDDK